MALVLSLRSEDARSSGAGSLGRGQTVFFGIGLCDVRK
jgi:hypothetical protein